jgi:hypothetical protein
MKCEDLSLFGRRERGGKEWNVKNILIKSIVFSLV